jgi:hypothetical protein
LLVRAGFSRVRIATVEFAYQHIQDIRLPMPSLDPVSLCLVDLPLVARGARGIACLALGGMRNVLDGAILLATLLGQGGTRRIRVFCPKECTALLDGFDVQVVDPRRFAVDIGYREIISQCLIDFAPELIVNLDPERGIQGDDLVHSALPAGAIGYEFPDSGLAASRVETANSAYTRLVPQRAGQDAMLEALGLK